MAYAWRITRDFFPMSEAAEGTNGNALGVTGPRDAPDDLVSAVGSELLGERFRMLDDDGNVYYEGRIVGDYDGFEPLDDFGMPNAGCTTIEYRGSGGSWKQL